MVDIAKENPLTLSDAAALLNRSYKTVLKWTRQGLRGRVLETRVVGGSVYTSREAIQRFSTGPEGVTESAPSQRTNAADEKARKRLSRRGVDGGKWKKQIAKRSAKHTK